MRIIALVLQNNTDTKDLKSPLYTPILKNPEYCRLEKDEMASIELHTGTGVFAVLANVCRSPQEALKQFVENGADAIEQSGSHESRIAIQLQYEQPEDRQVQNRLKRIIVEDNGVGMSQEKMHQVLNHIGDSEKINLALRGEQGIGILSFGLIAEEIHFASSTEDGKVSSCLVLKRDWLKDGHAEIINHCSSHEHKQRGTHVFLEDIVAEVAPQLSKTKIKEYLGQQFASDLRANLYEMTISDDHESEAIHPRHFRGVKVMSTNVSLGHNSSVYIELYVLPWEVNDAVVGLYGRGGTRICSMVDVPDFDESIWTDQHLEGFIRCDSLKRTADKTAIVQDQVFHTLTVELHKLEPKIQELVLKVNAESQEHRFSVALNRASRLIDKFLRYREQGKLTDLTLASTIVTRTRSTDQVRRTERKNDSTKSTAYQKLPVATRAPHIKLLSPSAAKANYHSWYDAEQEAICVNREHIEFLLSQRETKRFVRYLFTIWAKENLLQEFGTNAERIAEEMVSVLAEAEPLIW